ncbi:hypothetical protein TSTA_054290 [Talaromyces stipitatus ATCC 10500]|uniref:Zn(2)-C6 fungal-type domain-containing protein n=1 Tax=Talaromyces stipitatus (strain ATCC 10500 / CBS 375.48 / QM 6759 / NRRL 1006) TaxID=441959 RepID=B8MR23_TALSN|nr:uncharacterized protein TSTA_054290 [Talaromyces stipitatus ATCC 10500]EED12918.1 hypothetical protein TSTA_054290 [Talaromyces stipitatus ATCC 10500]
MSISSSNTRTNSLAFAKTDCHTCTAHRRQCDRKRPRCSTCSGKDILCGGYPMQLTWSRSESFQRRADLSFVRGDDPFYLEPLSFQASLHARSGFSRSVSQRYQKLEFVSKGISDQKQTSASCKPRTRRRLSSCYEIEPRVPSKQRSISRDTTDHEITSRSPLFTSSSGGTVNNEHIDVSDPFSMGFPHDCFFSSLEHWSLPPIENIGLEQAETCLPSDTRHDLERAAAPSPMDQVDSTFIDPRQLMVLRSPVLYEDLYGKYEQLLNMYDQEFCVIPLSGDIPSNPLRCRIETCHRSRSLLHAILAVSCYHARRQEKSGYLNSEIDDHYKAAQNLYHKDLDSDLTRTVHLLDTTMILFLFRATQSAFSNWTTHISDAGKLLHICGGPEFWANNRRVQAQVALLLWWDATIALISRQGCMLPYSYFESLLALENNKYWSFFDLVGCPRDLIIHLMQLTNLARENEQALSMRCTKFDPALVNNTRASISEWRNPSTPIDNNLPEEAMQQQRDRWNCTETWRYGLLIYITRVFLWNRESNPPNILVTYARLIFEHVQSCRRTSIVAKQAFFPLFLAGCETKDPFLRQSIREFCQYWDRRSGYNLFNSASSLLEEIWRERSVSSNDGVWWGSIIDKKQQACQLHGIQMRFCFG